MKIIEFEALDKAGKHTQTLLLKKFLEAKGYKVVNSEFHRYDTPTGKLIQQWLYKQYDVDTETIKLIMTADKQAQQKWFKELEEQEKVDFLILDRYYASNICYSQSEGLDIDWITTLQKHLRKPDISILLDISPEESMHRKGQHGANDRYESNRKLLTGVRQAYLDYFEAQPEKSIILKDIDKLSVEQVHEKITEELNTRFLIN